MPRLDPAAAASLSGLTQRGQQRKGQYLPSSRAITASINGATASSRTRVNKVFKDLLLFALFILTICGILFSGQSDLGLDATA